MHEQLCNIASCISKYQISDQLFARIESCAGLMDGSQPNLRRGHLTEFANSLVLPCLARPANAPQPEAKSLTQMKAKNIKTGKQSKNVKGWQRGLGRVGDYWAWFGSYIPACWLLMVVVISVDAQCVVFVFLVCVCVCVRPWIFFAASLPCLQTIWWGNSWGCPASQSILPVPNILACPSSPIAIIEKSVWLMNADNRRQFPSRSVK